MRTRRCRSCGAEVVWVVTTHGRPMPLDARPATMFIVETNGERAVGRAVQVRASHFSTCPHASQWRGQERSDG
jgi:hypothetical protein